MNEMGQETQQNRKLLYVIIAILFVLSAFFFKFAREQKRENNALKIKLITLNKTRTITPWERLISRPQISPAAPAEKVIQDIVTTRASSTTTPATAVQSAGPIENLSTPELATGLAKRMSEVKTQDLPNIQKNIEIANEIISREPDSYSAYKAKLISLLTMEGKLNQEIDDSEVNSILETMASFDLTNDSLTRKEAVLISNTTKELTSLEDQLQQVSSQRLAIEEQLELVDPNSPEIRALEIERENLLNQEEVAANRIVELNNNLEAGFPEEQYLNEDIVQIPFLRMMAKSDYEGVIDNAESFIEQFPTSPDGYYFLIKAFEATGRNEDALRVIQNSRLPTDAQNSLQRRLQNTAQLEPQKYWERLRF